MEIMDPPKGPRMILARLRIGDYKSSLSEEIERATAKRNRDHNTGRFLLESCIGKLNLPIGSLEVLRTEERAPYLSWIEGVWNNSPLPGISIGHSGDWAVCALIEPGWWIGIDAEPANRGIQENAFDMMASGEELAWLRANPGQAIRIWTAKESIQKAERMGMNLNPRQINIDDYEVHSFLHDDLMVSVSWRPAGQDPRTPEDELLDATLEKMKENPDFAVGCATTRGNC